MFVSKAPSGSVPLPLRVWRIGLANSLDAGVWGTGDFERNIAGGAPRDRACGRSGGSESGELSRCARNESVFASKAPSGSVPLPLVRVWPMGLANALDSRGWGTRGS